MAMKFTDNTNGTKILAIDFDGCITRHNEFPKIGEIRPYVKKVIDILHQMGVKIVIWTCRDKGNGYNDQTSMIEYLAKHEIHYDAINGVMQYAPWHYEARKIYAHMYVDDCGYGWKDTDDIFIDVMEAFMINHMGFNEDDVYTFSELVRKDTWSVDDCIDWAIMNIKLGR